MGTCESSYPAYRFSGFHVPGWSYYRLEQVWQLVAEHVEQLLDEAGCTDPSELPKLQADISRFTFAVEQAGQQTS